MNGEHTKVDAPPTEEPNLGDYIERWSKKNLAPSAQELGAREEHASDLVRHLRGEIERLKAENDSLRTANAIWEQTNAR